MVKRTGKMRMSEKKSGDIFFYCATRLDMKMCELSFQLRYRLT